jgi:hypothetical protein
MARDAPPTTGHSGLYARLLEREQDEARLRECTGIPAPGNQTRLAALRAGRSVDVCAGDLPRWSCPAGEKDGLVAARGGRDG